MFNLFSLPARWRREWRRLVANHSYDFDDDGNLLIGRLGFRNYQLVSTTDNPDERRYPNLATIEGKNHFLDVVLHGTSAIPTWYVAPFSSNVTVNDALTAATFHATVTELSTEYSESTRPVFNEVAASGGATNNTASPAVVTAAEALTIYGAGLLSVPTKQSTSGVLLFVAKYASVEALNAAGNTLGIKWALDLNG